MSAAGWRPAPWCGGPPAAPDAAAASGGPGCLPAGDSAPGMDDVRGPGSGTCHAMGVQLGSWLLIPVCRTSSAKVVCWSARLTCVAQEPIRVTAAPGR
jgi:hypothetical protein